MTREQLVAKMAEAMFTGVPKRARNQTSYPGITKTLAARALVYAFDHIDDIKACDVEPARKYLDQLEEWNREELESPFDHPRAHI